jgi:hypothetical protein
MAVQPTSATMPSAQATMLRTNSGSSCRWLHMIPSLGTNAATDTLPGSGWVRAARCARTSKWIGSPALKRGATTMLPMGSRSLRHVPLA